MRKLRLLGVVLISVLLIGCGSSSTSQTLITKNDKVFEITLEPSKNYTITGTEDFAIIKGGNTIAKGEMLDGTNFDTYRKTVQEEDTLASGTISGNDYIAWEDTTGYKAAVKVRNTDVCILLTDNISEDSLREILEIMQIQDQTSLTKVNK